VREVVLLDTEPLVAWLCDTDQWHEWSADQFGRLEPAFVTCEAVLTEACFLYARAGGDPAKIIGKVRQGLLDATFTFASEAAGIELLMQRYDGRFAQPGAAVGLDRGDRSKVAT
jgi:predicted nucleic acid-binding protein